ncbi:MAG TPA: nicotinate (nicotinamide) nucleotide adenylyltransferase [Anaeromyxobacteraceae bacterium]|nr:nicotinate (nicotinamide) nucleotide adenylyltransferase [Anaeromyxobacteraceae bacterium]
MTRKEVALLGGSFNPPHVGHAMVAWWVLATQPVDEAWLLPSFVHPFGKALAPWEDRVRMCELAVASIRGARVCTAEAELEGDPLVGRTARTLEHLVAKHPDHRFALVLGTDLLAETGRWYRFDRVKELARLIVVGRQGFEPVAGAPSMPEVSSSAIRQAIAAGRDVSGLLPKPVAEYIVQRGLYSGS